MDGDNNGSGQHLKVVRDSFNEESDLGSIISTSPLTGDKFPFSAEQLELHDPKSLKKLHEIGGKRELELGLKTDSRRGIQEDESDLNRRVEKYGVNRLPIKSQKGFFRLCFEALKDKVLILLSVAAVVSLALGLYETFGSGTEYDDEGKAIPKVDWVEGVAIIVAIVIVVVVGALNDYQKERQFAKLNAKKEDYDVVVIRNGEEKMISINDLLVGDLINVETGDVVPADAVLVDGDIECDESSITGESRTIKKVSVDRALEFYESQLPTLEDLGSSAIKFKDPFLISDAKVLSGLGHAIVTAVGPNSLHGKTMLSLRHEPETTPLQVRLDNLAEGISKYGFLAALILFIVLFIRFCVNIGPGGKLHNLNGPEKGKHFMDILITAITIVVVAVPEGLPLAVTLALAFATTRMAQNGNLVRVLKSCETMGGATTVCSDKTGTLTENRMRVVKGFVNGIEFDDTVNSSGNRSGKIFNEMSEPLKRLLEENIIINSTAFENSNYDPEKEKLLRIKPDKKSFLKQLFSDSSKHQKKLLEIGQVNEPFIGNKTEAALLILARNELDIFSKSSLKNHRNVLEERVVQIIPFESSRKWSGIVLKKENGYRFYAKGAAEIMLKCSGYCYTDSKVKEMDRLLRDLALSKIDTYADDALRAIALCHKDFDDLTSWPPAELIDPNKNIEASPEKLVKALNPTTSSGEKLVLDLIVGIQDPLKEGIPEAVLQCKKAGVSVKMVTGDNLTTAKAISRSCNILTPDDLSNEYAYLEGPEFRKLTPQKRTKIAKGLKVLARSSPEDKRILVETLRNAGEVVAVTGDGTNDAPALKLADVGFSMGISGTEVAREASDIILMTDDFADIVQAIKWGRTVSVSIKKFIQFQLTVNITACILTFVSAVASSDNKSVLTAVQLLWVNLIMDTLAALALATDKPDDSFLNKKPAGRHQPLISASMWKMILGQAATQLTVTFILHFAGQKLFFGSHEITSHQSAQLDAMTFNTFVWLQFWKLVVTRKLDEADDVTSIRGRITRENLDFFQHLTRNWYFLAIALIIGGCQILIMFVGGAAFSISHQTAGMWATAILCGFISIPVGAIIRIIPNTWVVAIFPTKAFNVFIYLVTFQFLKRSNKEKDLEKAELEHLS